MRLPTKRRSLQTGESSSTHKFDIMATDTGLSVGGFIGIVIALAILNVVGVIGYNKFDIDVSVNLDSDRVPKLR